MARLAEAEQTLKENEAQIIHLERLLLDSRDELAAQQSSLSQQERSSMEAELSQLRTLTTEQDEVIGEMEGRIGQMVEALEKAADAGLTPSPLKRSGCSSNKSMNASANSTSKGSRRGPRRRAPASARHCRPPCGLLDARDRRLAELEEQLERVMQGPRSVSAEHDYLVEQIEELKRRLLERNREYESLRRRERRLHNDVFERDERLQQMTLTMTDLEAALQDRTAELRELEDQRSSMEHELHSARRSERTREVVGRVFADSLSLVRSHESRELKRELYANAPDMERTIKAPTADDMAKLADGEEVALETEETELEPGMDVDGLAHPRLAVGDPVVFDDEDSLSTQQAA